MSILIKGATILTQDASRSTLRGDILIEEGRISEVAPSINERSEFTLHAEGRIAMPGLVNAHTHVGMTILRGHGEGLPLHRWLEERIWPAEARQSPIQAGLAAKVAFCEMIRSGTTAFADMCLHDPTHVAEAARQSGLRGLVSRGMLDLNHKEWLKKAMKEATASLSCGGGLVRPSVAAHSPYTCSQELISGLKDLARRQGMKFQLHVSETRKEIFEVLRKKGSYPYEYLDSIGVMDGDCIFAHGGWLTKKEIALAGKRGLSVASCPVSNLKLATGGVAQLAELHEAGANVCLGTDGAASNNSLDMFQTMKMASLLQKHHYWKADILPAGTILDFATRNGARALGFDAGSIEAGKLADIILLERGPNMVPENDLGANLVYSAGPQNVTDVIVDGRLVMEKRRILTMDEGSAMAEASAAAEELLRTGAPLSSG